MSATGDQRDEGRCASRAPSSDLGYARCDLRAGHGGSHSALGETWPAVARQDQGADDGERWRWHRDPGTDDEWERVWTCCDGPYDEAPSGHYADCPVATPVRVGATTDVYPALARDLNAEVPAIQLREAEEVAIDVAHLARQREWSRETFGPGDRAKGVVDHIRKELREIEADPTDLREWVDVVILALDGAWRSGAEPAEIIAAIKAKQARNEARQWPDWRTADPDRANRACPGRRVTARRHAPVPRRPLAAAYARVNDRRWLPHVAIAAAIGLTVVPVVALADAAAPSPDVDVTAEQPPTQTAGRTAVASIVVLPPTGEAHDPGKAPGDAAQLTVTATQTPAGRTTTAPGPTRTAVATVVIAPPAPGTATTTATVTAAPPDCLDPRVECACDHLVHDPDRDCDPLTSSTPTPASTPPADPTTTAPATTAPPSSAAPATSSQPEPTPETTAPETTADAVDELREGVTP